MVLAAPTSAWRNGAGRLDIDDDAESQYRDQIIVEARRMPVLCARWTTGLRDLDGEMNLGDDVAGCTSRWFVEYRQISFTGAAGPRWIAIPTPILTCDRKAAYWRRSGLGFRIDCEAFAANQTGRDTSP